MVQHHRRFHVYVIVEHRLIVIHEKLIFTFLVNKCRSLLGSLQQRVPAVTSEPRCVFNSCVMELTSELLPPPEHQ